MGQQQAFEGLMAQAAPVLDDLLLTTSRPSVTLSHTTNMMQSYLQGDVVAAPNKFEALQMDDGHSILFGLSSANVLQAIVEQSGANKTGWDLTDLSSALLKSNLPGSTDAVVSTFDVNQSCTDGTIWMAMAVTSGGTDTFFLSMSNSNSDTSWTANPSWVPAPFDAADSPETNATISIVGIMFTEPSYGVQFLIVDIDRSSNSSVKDISRYYVDPNKMFGTYWTAHDVPVDIEAGKYQSCVGRAGGEEVDGVYTSGTADGAGQLVYVPICNPWGTGPPDVSRFSLPGDVPAAAIATARNAENSSYTDLYAIGGSTLYLFAAGTQDSQTVGVALTTNDFFLGTTKLSAMTRKGVSTIWGKNASDEVYYTSCPTDKLEDATAWSISIPILTGVELMSPFVNRRGGGNTIFASGSNKLQRLMQATGTSSQMWTADEIKLKAAPTEPCLSFNSYTTTIKAVLIAITRRLVV
jgi:hypothetical protein